MTFKELNEKLGGCEAAADWKQTKDGGWVFKTARVSGNAIVFGNAIVSGDARVSGGAMVFGNARVFENARVSGDAQVFGNAQVFGGSWTTSPLFIVGSRFSLTNAKPGYIQIGCECHTFADWKRLGPALATREGFSAAEVAEYTAYVELFSKIGK